MSCATQDSRMTGGNVRYSCQATELLNYTAPLKWWDPQTVRGSLQLRQPDTARVCRGLFYLFYYYGNPGLQRSMGTAGPLVVQPRAGHRRRHSVSSRKRKNPGWAAPPRGISIFSPVIWCA